ncbi:MAG: sigma-54-dependent transcriptional regulator [Desulfopila sp.]
MPEKILFVDDEAELLMVLKRSFSRQGYTADTTQSGEEAWKVLSETMYDLIVCDLAMDGMSGLDLLKRVKSVDSNLPFIIMTGAGSIATAVEAIQFGAYHYITKPFNTQELALLSRRAIEYGKLHRQMENGLQDSDLQAAGTMVTGTNPLVLQLLATLNKVAQSETSILIQGETGTGKSLFAKYTHTLSARADKPFYTIDCGALSEHLLESELFGHVIGAFTGAVRAKRGLLEEAQGGTIFLDEIGELTLATQVKLLRAIQEKEIKPVGGNTPIPIDVRFLAATSRNLEVEVETGGFRKDLFYRLAVIPLYLPPLRERKEDLALFVDRFVRKYSAQYKKDIRELSPGALQTLLESPWKGNIRELENVIERAVLLTDGQIIFPEVLGTTIKPYLEEDTGQMQQVPPLKKVVERAEADAIKRALIISEGNRSQAAKILEIGRRTLYEKLAAYNI